ncbi:MAG: YkgJ family cysteine cluster protein [Candidatus Omnitrophica bacterium]|nr:YkgJ family cysteine cluster protein [Candidatus Omnitrophota bacterium]MBD3269343.1 YkgJ family cysteine cluster protein [Candidatus Omnitrophota bacterium]
MSGRKNIKNKDCKICPAICCKNLAMEIGKPANNSEVEDLRWQLHFDTVKVFIRNRRWYQLVEGRCIYLTEEDRCAIYENRPQKCRKHNPPDCEYFGEFYDILISTPEELDSYFESLKKSKKKGPKQISR